MTVFETFRTVVAEDLDDLNHVNNVRYVQWIQDISEQHWKTATPPKVQKQWLWVVAKHTIHYMGSAVLGDIIHIKTYVSKSEGAINTRIVEMYHKASGRLLVQSETDWCLLNNKTLKPTRVPEIIGKTFNVG